MKKQRWSANEDESRRNGGYRAAHSSGAGNQVARRRMQAAQDERFRRQRERDRLLARELGVEL